MGRSGILLGLLGAWSTSRAAASLLFNVSATDPLTFALAAFALGESRRDGMSGAGGSRDTRIRPDDRTAQRLRLRSTC